MRYAEQILKDINRVTKEIAILETRRSLYVEEWQKAIDALEAKKF